MKKETLEKTIRQELAQPIRNHYVGIIKDFQTAQDKHERGEISKEAFAEYEKNCNHLLETLEALEYQILNGPRREFSRLIRIRKEQGLTQAEAAIKAGMSLAWYALLEQGFKEKISMKQQEKVAEALGISHFELFQVAAWWGKKTPEEIDKYLGFK